MKDAASHPPVGLFRFADSCGNLFFFIVAEVFQINIVANLHQTDDVAYVMTVSNGRPLAATIISPGSKPAFAAGELLSILLIAAPCLFVKLNALTSSGVRSCVVTPSKPRRTSPCLTSDSLIVMAIFDGIAKPMPTLPPVGARIAVLMPINSPRRLTSAPPELPG